MGWTPGTETWPKIDYNYNSNQKEIEYFWPLTEQIELDLDYTRTYDYNNEKFKLSTVAQTGQVLTIANGTTSAVWISANEVNTLKVTTEGIETPEITFTLNKKPDIIKRMLYKYLGINWKIK